MGGRWAWRGRQRLAATRAHVSSPALPSRSSLLTISQSSTSTNCPRPALPAGPSSSVLLMLPACETRRTGGGRRGTVAGGAAVQHMQAMPVARCSARAHAAAQWCSQPLLSADLFMVRHALNLVPGDIVHRRAAACLPVQPGHHVPAAKAGGGD